VTRRLLAIWPLAAFYLGSTGDPLVDRMNEFVVAYNDFAKGVQAGIFDQRQARRLSKLWRQVEKCGSWPPEK